MYVENCTMGYYSIVVWCIIVVSDGWINERFACSVFLNPEAWHVSTREYRPGELNSPYCLIPSEEIPLKLVLDFSRFRKFQEGWEEASDSQWVTMSAGNYRLPRSKITQEQGSFKNLLSGANCFFFSVEDKCHCKRFPNKPFETLYPHDFAQK